MIKLVIQDEEGRRTTVPLVRSEITIGRAEGNTIRLTERNVSRTHARIFRADGTVFVEDTSRYGSTKNGTRFTGTREFAPADLITIGDFRLRVIDESVSVDLPPEGDFAHEDTMPAATSPDSGADTPHGKLVCIAGALEGREIALTRVDRTIGSGVDADVTIDDAQLETVHARLSPTDTSQRITLVSAGAMSINGQAVTSMELRSGDRIEVGGLTLVYLDSDESSVELFELAEAEARSGARPWWVYAAGAALLLALIIAVVVRSSGGQQAADSSLTDPERATQGSGESVADRGTVDPDVTERPELAEAPPPANSLIIEGQRHLTAGEWDRAIAMLGNVGESDPNYDLALSLADQARRESDNEGIWQRARALESGGEFEAAIRAVDSLPNGSWYASVAAEDGLRARAADAWAAELVPRAQSLRRREDYRGARHMLAPVDELVPGQPAVTAELRRIASEERGADGEGDDEAARQLDREQRRARATELKREAGAAAIAGNHQRAIVLLEEARGYSSDAAIDLALYNSYRAIGNEHRAARHLRRYLERRPNSGRRAEYEAWLEAHGN